MKKLKAVLNDSEKLKVFYTPDAFSKIVRLVMSHEKEIGWNMVVSKCDGGYRVTDVLVYPQKASSAYLSIDLGKYGLWKAQIPEEADKNLFGQGHSHVNMAVMPSSTDTKQQLDEIRNKGEGFYLFQIWNKKMEVNSFLYDIDNGLMYDKEDIELIIEEDDFIKDSRDKLCEDNFIEWRWKDFEPIQII